jgi:hypothetical protein
MTRMVNFVVYILKTTLPAIGPYVIYIYIYKASLENAFVSFSLAHLANSLSLSLSLAAHLVTFICCPKILYDASFFMATISCH